MKKFILTITLVAIVVLVFFNFIQTKYPIVKGATNPGEEYLLTRQYPAFGEGLDEYKRAVQKELKRMKKTRAINTPWQNEGPYNTGGRINCIAVHPTAANTYLVGTADGGIFKTTDDGATWSAIFDNATSLSVSSIVFAPNNASILYAGTGDQVLGGYSHMGNGIYKSTDGGLTWTNTGFLGLNAGIGDLIINPTNSSILYATGRRRIRSDVQSIITGPEARIYKSSNGGLTWDTLTNGLPAGDQSRIGLCISANNPNLIYANYVDTSLDFGGLYKSTNGGNSWSLVCPAGSVSMGGFGWYFGEIRIDPNNDNTLYLLSVSLYKSTNGGSSFTAIGNSLHADKHDLKFMNSNTLLIATDGGFYKSTNAGTGWTMKNNLPITQFYEVAYNPWDTTNYYGGAQDNGTNYGSLAGGLNNWLRYYGGDGFRPQFSSVSDQVQYAEWQNGNIVASTNGGGFFNTISQSIVDSDRCSWNTPYLVSQFNPDVLYAGS